MSEQKKFKKVVEQANQIHVQIKVLEALSEKKMTSQELREFIESHGGDYYRILPLLKNAKLIKVEPVNDGKRGRKFVYSINNSP